MPFIRAMAQRQHRLEWIFERWLWRFRLIAIVPVVMSSSLSRAPCPASRNVFCNPSGMTRIFERGTL